MGGLRREAIFEDDEDRRVFLSTLAEVVERFHWICHAYCLMTNHYHLVVETPDANLSKGMRQLNGVYTQASNRRHGRVGHLFQGRFKGILVDKEGYLLELTRYVVLNPVRAGMVAQPGQWSWSSYRAMVGEEASPEWLAGGRGDHAEAGGSGLPRRGSGQPRSGDHPPGQVQDLDPTAAAVPDMDRRRRLFGSGIAIWTTKTVEIYFMEPG